MRIAEIHVYQMDWTEHVNSYYALPVLEPNKVARLAAEKIADGYLRLQIKGGRPSGRSRHRDHPEGLGGHGMHAPRGGRQPGIDNP